MEPSAVYGPAFERETDRLTGTRVREGNSAVLLPSGAESYALRWEMIDAAEKSVHMVSFSFMRDDTTRRLAALCEDKVRQGVDIRIIVDDAALLTTRSRSILDGMARAGVEVLTYNPPRRYLTLTGAHGHPLRRAYRNGTLALKRRFHEKYMIVDGRNAILGGMNWGTKYALGGTDPKWWRDSDVNVSGPVVADIERRFLTDVFVYRAQAEDWRRRRKSRRAGSDLIDEARKQARAYEKDHADTYFPHLSPTGAHRIRYVPHKPWDEQALPLTNAELQLIRTAQSSIYWGCHGVRPPRIVAENLADAAARGVDVNLITNSKRSSRSLMGNGLMGWMWWECSHYFRWLVEHGIRVHQWQLPGAFHSKNLVVDDTIAAVGSYNVANGSTFHHTESALIMYGAECAGVVRKQFDADLRNCQEVTLAEAHKPVLPLDLFDPWRRDIHERNLLIDRSLWPDGVATDIAAGKVKWKYEDPPRASSE